MKTKLFFSVHNDLVFLKGTERGEYARELECVTTERSELINILKRRRGTKSITRD